MTERTTVPIADLPISIDGVTMVAGDRRVIDLDDREGLACLGFEALYEPDDGKPKSYGIYVVGEVTHDKPPRRPNPQPFAHLGIVAETRYERSVSTVDPKAHAFNREAMRPWRHGISQAPRPGATPEQRRKAKRQAQRAARKRQR